MAPDGDLATAFLAVEFVRLFPTRAAAELEGLPSDELIRFLCDQPADTAAALLEALRPDVAAEVILGLDVEYRKLWLPAVDPGWLAVVMGRLDETQRFHIIECLDALAARELAQIMSFPPDTAGSIMDRRVNHFRPQTSAESALVRLRELRRMRINSLHTVDEQGRYLGSVRVQDLAVAEPDQRLEELVSAAPVSVQAMASRAEVVELLDQHRLTAVPVVDFDGRLIGVIRQEALLSAVEAEATTDMQTMVGASRDEKSLSPITFAVKKRLPWLQINLLTAFLASFVVGLFEDTIARLTALAVLLPVVAGQSGNTGAQALAVTMRGLALREIGIRHAARVAMKESAVGAINGVSVALVTAAAVVVWSRSVSLAAVIGVSMVISMLIAGLAGATIPMLLTMLGQDPAQSSSIVLTTVTDVVGFLSFLGLASVFISL